MPAYVIADTKITDPKRYEDYKRLASPVVARHGGEYLARGGALDVFEDQLWTPSRLVVIRFPDMEAARAFAADPDYAEARAIRHATARTTLALVEGL